MKVNKWFDDKTPIQVGDVVYFQKEESVLSSRYTVGNITQVIKSIDGLVRKAEVQYQNASESEPRFTERAVRSLSKLFHIDDTTWKDDMEEAEKLVKQLQAQEEGDKEPTKRLKMEKLSESGLKFRIFDDQNHLDDSLVIGQKLNDWVKKRKCKKACCCIAHCNLASHSNIDIELNIPTYSFVGSEYPGILDRSWMGDNDFEEEVSQCSYSGDGLLSMILSVDTDFGGGTFN